MWVLPSIADVFFLVLLGILGFSAVSTTLLRDADTGWHIRNGEIIWATRSVPHVDVFSYTRAGQPWYAWEWLYDLVIGGIHHVAGLNGVVLFTAAIIAGTFAILFRLILRRSGSFAVAALLTLLANAAAQVHMLARPHVLSWLFTMLWVEVLYRFEEGKSSSLLWLPPMMLVWVNVHGGFILGLVLLGIFGAAEIWKHLTAPTRVSYTPLIQLGAAFCSCSAVSFLTPYGYKLHTHVYGYLSNHFLMDTIQEFRSPDFHAEGFGFFEIFILLAVVGVMLGLKRVSATDLLLLLFSIHAGLIAARNIPISGILMSFALAPALASAISPARNYHPRWLASLLDVIDGISNDMTTLERRFRAHALVIVVLAASAAIAINGGRFFSARVLSAHFDDKMFPVKATEYIAQQGIHDHMFNTDAWSGYLIYKLYPTLKVYFDDRHDFYGEDFLKEYSKARDASWQWREPLDKDQVTRALVSPASPLATVMKESKEWRVEYDDGFAIIFVRGHP